MHYNFKISGGLVTKTPLLDFTVASASAEDLRRVEAALYHLGQALDALDPAPPKQTVKAPDITPAPPSPGETAPLDAGLAERILADPEVRKISSYTCSPAFQISDAPAEHLPRANAAEAPPKANRGAPFKLGAPRPIESDHPPAPQPAEKPATITKPDFDGVVEQLKTYLEKNIDNLLVDLEGKVGQADIKERTAATNLEAQTAMRQFVDTRRDRLGLNILSPRGGYIYEKPAPKPLTSGAAIKAAVKTHAAPAATTAPPQKPPALKPAASRPDLTDKQAAVMATLETLKRPNGRLDSHVTESQNYIAAQAGVPKGSIVYLLDSLARKNLITKTEAGWAIPEGACT